MNFAKILGSALQNGRRFSFGIRNRVRRVQFRGSERIALYVTLAVTWPFSLIDIKKEDEGETSDDPEVRKQKERDVARGPLIKALQFAKLKTTQQKFPVAMRYYHDALRELNVLRQLQNDDLLSESEYQRAKVKIFLEMANAQMVAGQLRDAEALFVESLRELPRVGEDVESNAFLEVSLKLAEIYAHTKRYSQARDGFDYCTSVLSEKCENSSVMAKPSCSTGSQQLGTDADVDTHVAGYSCDSNTLALLGMALDASARFLYIRADYGEKPYSPSEHQVERTLVGRAQNQSSEPEDTSKELSAKELVTSLRQFERALAIATAIYGAQSAQSVRLRNELACVLSALHDTTKACAILESAISECKASQDEANLENLPVMQLNLGETLLQHFVELRRDAEAQRLARHAEANSNESESAYEHERALKVELNDLLKRAATLCKAVRLVEDDQLKLRADACLRHVTALHRSSTSTK